MTREDIPSPAYERIELVDRFHWPSIVGGAFLALSLFVIATVLARAIGLDYTYQSTQSSGQRIGVIVWGVVAALICFGLGGWLAARTAALATRGYGLLNGLMVWAVAVPLMVYLLGSTVGPRLGAEHHAPIAEAFRAAAQYGETQSITGGGPAPMAREHLQAASWWMLLSLVVGLIAASLAGLLGVRVITPTAPGAGRPAT